MSTQSTKEYKTVNNLKRKRQERKLEWDQREISTKPVRRLHTLEKIGYNPYTTGRFHPRVSSCSTNILFLLELSFLRLWQHIFLPKRFSYLKYIWTPTENKKRNFEEAELNLRSFPIPSRKNVGFIFKEILLICNVFGHLESINESYFAR